MVKSQNALKLTLFSLGIITLNTVILLGVSVNTITGLSLTQTLMLAAIEIALLASAFAHYRKGESRFSA